MRSIEFIFAKRFVKVKASRFLEAKLFQILLSTSTFLSLSLNFQAILSHIIPLNEWIIFDKLIKFEKFSI